MLRALAAHLLALFALATLPARVIAEPADVSRILRSFDFEERRLGNVEELPMHWTKVEGPGLPHYVNGQLASDRARSGQYSFRLELDGGSLVYRYQTGNVRVQRDAHYRVSGFVQTTIMSHARARLSAYFTDLDGHQIASSLKHSPLYAATADAHEWKELTVELTADDPAAAYLVIEVELLNPSAYLPADLGQRTLFPQDIHGVAWFDDIVVSQVPQVIMSTERPGNIFRRSDPLKLSVVVNDRVTDDLAAQLVVHDAMGRVVHQRSGALDMTAAQKLGPGQKRMGLTLPEDLPPGWYSASLEMSSHGQFVGRQSLDLVRLADDAPAIVPDPRFGVIATDLPFDGWSELPSILPLLAAGRVKLGVWSDDGDIQQVDSAGFDRLLERLAELRITPTACLLKLPPNVREKIRMRQYVDGAAGESMADRAGVESSERDWLQLLKTPTEIWQPQLAYIVARHANHLDRWQLGEDGSDVFVTSPKMRDVYRMVYREFSNLVQKPDLAMPWPAWYELDGQAPATVALHVKPDVLPSQLPLYTQDVKGSGFGVQSSVGAVAPELRTPNPEPSLSLYLEPLDRAQYGRDTQIRDLAQRICYALTADAQRIDLKLPFTVRRVGDSIDKQPQELLMIVRTMMMMLGNATFKGKVPIAEGVEAFLFDRNGEGVLMLWTRGTDAGVKPLALNLGRRPMRVDIWGNVTPLVTADKNRDGSYLSPASAAKGKVELSLGPMPIFLVDIDGQLAQLRASVAFDNDHIESSFRPHTRRLRFTNPYHSSIGGSVKLTAPKGWIINPPTQTFTLNPGETFDREVTIEFPYNSFAGPKTVTAEFSVQAETNNTFSVPLVLKLGLSDVGLQTMALRDGKDVIVQQMITNYGEKPIDYTAYAIYPGQARQERLVTNLAPGRTTMKRYRFTDVTGPADVKVRSGVKELVGTRVLNDEVTIQ